MPVTVSRTKCYKNGKNIVATGGRSATQNCMTFPKKLLFILNVEMNSVNMQTTVLVAPKYSNKPPTVDVLRYQDRKFSSFS